MKPGKITYVLIVVNVLLMMLGGLFSDTEYIAEAKEPTKEKQREEVRTMSSETLSRLYKIQPEARPAIQKAAGYAVFSDLGVKIFIAGSGSGNGIVVDNTTKKETFMKMFEAQGGLGLGIKKFRVVFVFENKTVLNDFINSGWEFGGQATAAAQAGGKGGSVAGAVSVKPGVWMYQLTDNGLAVEITVKGTKYYKDDALNSP
jgi:lipid-binding SYLF domain-containing protein